MDICSRRIILAIALVCALVGCHRSPPPPGHFGSSNFAFPVGPAGGDWAGTFPAGQNAGLRGGALPDAGTGALSWDGGAWYFGSPPSLGGAFYANSFSGVDPTGTNDSGPGLQTALNAAAGGTLFLSGHYKINTTVSISNNTDIVCAPGTTFTGTIPNNGGPTAAFFIAQPSATLGTTTLASNAVFGATTCSVTAIVLSGGTIAAGMWIELANVPIGPIYRGAAYKVLAVSGSGPYTVTLDRPMKYVFSAADSVSLIANIPQNIHFYGNGATVTGSVTRYFEWVSARDCSIEDVNVIATGGSASDYAMSWDVAGYRSFYRRVTVDGGGVSTGGLRFETDESCGAEDSHVKNVTAGPGFQIVDGVDCTLTPTCSASENAFGVMLGSQDVVIERGCNWTKLGGNYDNNVDYGILITAGTTFTQADQFTANGNGLIGVYLDGTGALMQGNTFSNGSIQNTGTYGVEVIAGTKGTVLDNLNMANSGTYDMLVSDDATITNLRIADTSAAATIPLLVNGSGNVTMSHFSINNAATGASLGAAFVGSVTAQVDDGVMRLGSGNTGLYVGATAVVKASKLQIMPIAGHSGEIGISLNSSTCVLRMGDGVDPSACATPFSNGSGGFVNRFTKALAGAATTVVSWPNLTAQDNIQLQVQSKGGTLEGPYGITPNPGTGFTITPLGGSPSSDTSTLQVVIQ